MTDATASSAPDKGAESPTTARPIEFDDDQQETGVIHSDGTTNQNPTPSPATRPQRGVRFEEDEAPPTKPPRPMSPQQQNEAVLIEAFPSLDAKVIKAVLSASGGQVEPAFNALLGMSDPDFQDEAPPAQPARPTAEQRQMQQDEMYARQLAEQYNRPAHGYAPRSTSLPQGQPPNQNSEREYSFIDDDLPEIRETVRQGFIQTQSKVNQWISDFRKKIDSQEGVDHDDDDDLYASQGPAAQRQNFGPSQSEQLYGIQKNAQTHRARQSTDRNRYDEDNHVLGDDFTQLELKDNEEDEKPPAKPTRPQANPNLFKPTPSLPPQSGPVDEIDAAYGSTQRQPSPAVGSSAKKWQPITSVAPNPDLDDNDPFSLGDSDDDKDSKTKDIRAEDTERLKQSASEVTGEGAQSSDLSLGPAERSGSMGTRNKEAEDLMKGSSS